MIIPRIYQKFYIGAVFGVQFLVVSVFGLLAASKTAPLKTHPKNRPLNTPHLSSLKHASRLIVKSNNFGTKFVKKYSGWEREWMSGRKRIGLVRPPPPNLFRQMNAESKFLNSWNKSEPVLLSISLFVTGAFLQYLQWISFLIVSLHLPFCLTLMQWAQRAVWESKHP